MAGTTMAGACPRCGANALTSVSVARARVPEALAKEYFAAAGPSADPNAVVQVLCGRCGCRFVPRTADERRLRALSGQLGKEAQLAAQADEVVRAAAAASPAGAVAASVKRRPLVWVLVALIVAELVVSFLL